VNGLHDIGACLADGRRAAQDTAADIDVSVVAGASWNEARLATDAAPGSRPPDRGMAGGKQFVDLQGDVTTKDVRQAYDESYVSVEHLKRYTTLGMGTDQGKTSNINGLTRLAGLREEPVPQVGATTFRPPYTPVTLATVAGRLWDEHLHPSRHTVMHDLHAAAGARFDFNGLWLRPQCYPQPGESVEHAVAREVLAVRGAAGMTDISTLGKFEIQGNDCVEFLNRVYINNWGTLSVGRTRYGVMLRDDGMVLDDGTVTRLGEQHFFITTSTGHAEHVQQHFEHLLDVAWPDLDVNLVCVTEQWAGAALAGPESRGILQQLVHTADVPLEELPYMGYTAATIGTDLFCIQARIMRVSFSGELAHEIYVPALRGCTLWRDLAACGADAGLVPYGMDAMDVMRIEKGFIGVGAEADGRTTPDDIGFGGMVSTNKAFVGHHALQRPALRAAGRLQLVGLRPREPLLQLREGSQLIAGSADRGFGASIGHISSAGVSPTLGHSVALALVQDGRSRMGEVIYSFDAARGERKPGAVEIVPPCAYDPDGKRVRA
jgi:sarcosine oxidase subunit alpha